MKYRLVGAALAALVLLVSPSAFADHTPGPTAVTIAGSLQSELGCPGDWDPACAATHLDYDASDDVWQKSFSVPAGSYEYKAPLNDSWDENYGANATPGGANIGLDLGAAATVKFYYDHKSHWVTSSRNAVIAVAPGSFQSELGCPGDWQPDCLRSWLQDPDGDGIYSFETTDLPAGSYETKVAINETWDENYGQGGVPGGANIPFTVPANGATVVFTYNASTHVLSVLAGHGPDNNVEWLGVRHDSRDTLYRTPGGAVVEGTPVKLRLRTFSNDVTGVKLRLFDVNANGQAIVDMQRVATGVSCYQADLAAETCDYWQAELPNAAANNLWYRFLVGDGTDTDYYADDTAALDGGLGAVTDEPVDDSYALTVSESGFTTPAWARSAVIYQIFPDRFRNGERKNDPKTGDERYDDPALALPWDTLPEGYCRNYADANGTTCPWRFDSTPPDWSPEKEGPRGRDYMGGDLEGVRDKLDYLESLGVTAIYFNPIFSARSNHRYDTSDYTTIDPYLGDLKDWEKLVKQAEKRGIRVILDGVFNHMSSDSPFFDRYGHYYPQVGACESESSAWRSWFVFTGQPGPCVPGVNYEGWFGFDTIPVLNKSNPAVQSYFLTAPNSIAKLWLNRGAGGWRMDVSGDPSFPSGYWETFRSAVKGTNPNALTISETWQKDTTLLRIMRGDRLDTSMNYRLRDAVVGLLSPHANFDSKGFADSGRSISPSEFTSRLASIYEDTPKPAADVFMNLLDSHDTERLRWTLTPGAETRAEREQNAANVAEGKARMKMASLVQFTVPGAPTVYYGDEVGVTGDDDPDDRRTMPWPNTGGARDTQLLAHYRALSDIRRDVPALVAGDLRILLVDDGAGTVAYGRKTTSQAAIVALNRSGEARTLSISVAGYVPDGTTFRPRFGTGSAATVAGGVLSVSLPARSGAVLATRTIDLAPPAAPNLTTATEGEGQVALAWNAVGGAAGHNVYRSPVSGGGYVKANAAPVTGTSFTDTGLDNGHVLHYVVRALDSAGNESASSNERTALPHLDIDWANLQWPPTMNHTISTTDRTDSAYGQVYIEGATSEPGQTPALVAQLCFGPDGSSPAGNPAWSCVEAAFNTQAGSNDEFVASLLPEAVGSYDYAYRYSTTDGRDWVYADLDGIQNGYDPGQAGHLVVASSGDTTAPATPTGLTVESASPAGIALSWDAVAGDPTLHGYEVLRSQTAGGPYTTLALVTAASYTDTNVTESQTYRYVVRSVDTSFNRSGNSAEVSATAELRTVSVVFDVTVPASTDGTGRDVYIAGSLNRLDGGLPEWNPGGVKLNRVDATHWTITLTGKESTEIEYKFTLGDWDHVEKGPSPACAELGNRQLTLSYGANGTQTANHTVDNWRNVAPCGN